MIKLFTQRLAILFTYSFLALKLEAVTKLNQPLMTFADVKDTQFQPTNGTRIVYMATPFSSAKDELFSVNYLEGPSSVTNLSGFMTSGGSVNEFQISPDGSQVVFVADKDTNNVTEIYSVPVFGGIVQKLNGMFTANSDVDLNVKFVISPDSTRVVYHADQDTDEITEIYSSQITGGNNVKLNGPLVLNGEVGGSILNYQALITPDSSHVIYGADQDSDGVIEIYSSQITGGGNVKLNGNLLPNTDVDFEFVVSPNSLRVVYLASQDQVGVFELYSSLVTGGGNVKLNGNLVPGGTVALTNYRISPNSTRVVYLATQDTNTVIELYSSFLAGGGNVKLNGSLIPTGDVSDCIFSPDSSRIIYLADQETEGVSELYSSLVTGGGNIKLNDPLTAGGEVLSINFKVSPDSQRVIYSADQDTNNVMELYSSKIVGGENVKLNGPLVTGGNVASSFSEIQISPDSKYVMYLADQDTDTIFECYLSSLTNNLTNAKVNTSLVAGGNVAGVYGFPDFQNPPAFHYSSRALYYIADQEVDGVSELYAVALTAPMITSPLVATATKGINFNYIITATNGPITSYNATDLPNWATLNKNIISGTPDTSGFFPITLSVTNDAGFDSKILNLTVNSNQVIIVPPSNTGFSGDFNQDGTLDLLAQKKTKVTLIALIEEGIDTSKILIVEKKNRVRAANRVFGSNALIVQNKTQINAILVDSNFVTAAKTNLGIVAKNSIKVMAAGDVNGDDLTDIITQQGKNIGVLLSPNFSFSTLGKTLKSAQKVVGITPLIGATSNAISSLLVQQGKKLFFYDISTNSLTLATEAQPGPVFNQACKVVGVTAGSNINQTKLIISKGKKVNVVNYGTTTFTSSIFKNKIGKIVGPK